MTQAAAASRPNILWICTDQHRYDALGVTGNPYVRTPNIDRLAEQGVTFSRAYTQSPVCTPSRACFLTGRYPRTTRVRQNGNEYFPKDEVLVTKLLADQGYDCGLVGKLHLSAAEGQMENRPDDGYRVFRWSQHPHDDWPGANDYQLWLKAQGIEWNEHYRLGDWKNLFPPGEGGIAAEYHQTTWCAEEAISFIKEERNEPWLLSVNIFDPHPPYDPPLAYREKYPADRMPLPKYKEGELDSKPPIQQKDYLEGGQAGTGPCFARMSETEKRQAIADYYAMIELIDDQVGRMIAALEESGQRERTIVIFMSDHGEMLGDHGLYWKGAYFYEELVHVPLIMSWPGKFAHNLRSDALVELVDLAPTLLEAAGIETPYYMQGTSLLPILTGQADPSQHKDHVYCEYYYALNGIHDTYATMYLDGKYKIVVYHGEAVGELYDLQADPNEFRNLWDDPDHKELKLDLLQRNFDSSVMIIDPKPLMIKYY